MSEIPEKSSAKTADNQDEGSIKDTIEAILVAFILAFVFRGFVVEAFVIPTGSMAPTLMGAHARFICDDCGYQFDLNINAPEDLDVPRRANEQASAICPNCGYELRKAEPSDQAYRPFVRYGDRILVLKYLYLFQPPQRWDVIVFKSPDQPGKFDYSQNYIKRLIGRPSEAIMVLDGDIYAGPRDAKREDLRIQRKPADVQDAMWRIIHDVDYQPRGLQRPGGHAYQEPWTRRSGQTGWDLGAADSGTNHTAAKREFTFNNPTGFAELFFNDRANLGAMRTSAFNDWLAYDNESSSPAGGWSYVADLKLQCFYQRRSGDGPLHLMLTKREYGFIAEIGQNSARLLSCNPQSHEVTGALTSPVAFPQSSGPMQIEFANADYRVTLRINGKVVIEHEYTPNVPQLLSEFGGKSPPPQVSIIASRQQATLSHISLWRDVFYLNYGSRAGQPFAASPDAVMRLNADEYFAMGDNSQVSSDGRYWTDRTNLPYESLQADAGKVPSRFLLGKAFFVYWPAGYRPFESAPAIAPDFGDMRMIH